MRLHSRIVISSIVILILVSPTAMPVTYGATSGTPSGSQIELKGSDTQSGDEFAYFTAVNGDTLLVGAPYHSDGGRAYVFTRSSNSWKQTAVLKGKDTGGHDVFGVDGKIDAGGNELIIGADEAHGTGAAYIFTRSGSTWKQAAELRGSAATPGNHYGLSVAISGSNAIVSTEDDNQAYIYHNTGSQWVQQAKLVGSDTQPGDEFGFWVGLDGTTAVVGADKKGSGAIYIFNQSGDTWKQTAELTGSDLTGAAHFGQNLAISGNTIVVNAPYMDNNAGRIYVFSNASGSWKQTAELKGNDTQNGNWFGWYVSIDGNTFAAGAEKTPNGGRVYVFTNTGGTWTQTAEFTGWDTVPGDVLGASTGVSGSTVVGGAFLHQGGRAYVFTGTGKASPSIIHVRARMAARVVHGARQSVTITTIPGSALMLTVSYAHGSGFSIRGTADGQGTWSYSWQVPASARAGTASVHFSVTVNGLTRNFTKRFQVASTAGPGNGTISIHGQAKNTFHTYFNETVSGTANGAADYVISGEQLNPAGGCASTYTAESARGGWSQWATGTGPASGHFSLVAKFYAANHGRHGICAYLVNQTTRQTYAHASLWWTNS